MSEKPSYVLRGLLEEMQSALDDAELNGIGQGDEDDFDIPPHLVGQVRTAMDRWDQGCGDLQWALTDLEKIADKIDEEYE